MARLANFPRLGRLCPELAPDLRRHEVASHVLFYRETESGIRILRVLNSLSLPASFLTPEPPERELPEPDLEKI